MIPQWVRELGAEMPPVTLDDMADIEYAIHLSVDNEAVDGPDGIEQDEAFNDLLALAIVLFQMMEEHQPDDWPAYERVSVLQKKALWKYQSMLTHAYRYAGSVWHA